MIVILAAAVIAVAGCSAIEDQISGSVNTLASEALEKGVKARLADAGVELQDGPNCETDLDRDGTALAGTATCDAVTVEGRSARALFDGTLTSSGCTGTVTIEVDGQVVVEDREVPECSVQL
jgi:outer membrane murein-binding lipoprotein Lpp